LSESEPSRFLADVRSDGPRTIVVGVDGSDTSWRAAAYAVGLARRQRRSSRLVFVHVARPDGVSALVPLVLPELRGAAESIRHGIESTLASRLADSGIDWELRTSIGSPFAEIKKTALAVQADAVVVGASTRAGHRFAGSVAVRLVRSKHWPVVVVP
jgi:nucleotide-binding universal stress UspA family protein